MLKTRRRSPRLKMKMKAKKSKKLPVRLFDPHLVTAELVKSNLVYTYCKC